VAADNLFRWTINVRASHTAVGDHETAFEILRDQTNQEQGGRDEYVSTVKIPA
jgi:hypothetical protein